MKIDAFFEKFELFAEAPGAVAKMRELVLDLGMSGRLLEQVPEDESTKNLLVKILKIKDRLVANRKIRQLVTNPIKDDDGLFSIPDSWVWTRLGEIGDWGSGSTPPRGDHSFYDGGMTWLKSGELNDNQALRGSEETVTELALEKCSFRRNQPGDVLLAMYGATIGKAAILAEKAVTNQAVCGCTPFEGIHNRFLFFFLISQRKRFHFASEGGAQPNISKVKIVEFPFPLASLAEQKRIVSRVDDLMALCDQLETQQQERDARFTSLSRASLDRFAEAPTPANLNFIFHKSYDVSPAELRKAILTLAVQGKLVLQDKNDEPALSYFEKIRSDQENEIRKGTYKKGQPLPRIEDAELPFPIPPAWGWFRLRSLVYVLGDGLHGTPEYSEGTDYFFINGNNLVNGRIVIKQSTKTVSVNEFRKLKKDMTSNTVLVSINGTIGSVAFYENEKVVLGKSACYFNLSKFVNKHFIRVILESQYFVEYAAKHATSTTIKNLGLKAMNHFPIPVPPVNEQVRIVERVEQLMFIVDQLETQLAESKSSAKNLMEALVAELAA